MRLCSIASMTGDMVLGRSIYDRNGTLLIAAGFKLTPELKVKLVNKGFRHVYIAEEGTEDVIPEDVISEEIRLSARAVLTDKVEEIQNLTEFKDVNHSKAMSLIEDGYIDKLNIMPGVKSIVDEILKDISAVGAKFMNTLMFKSSDTYFIDHSINTTILSILLGRRYGFKRSELISLALGSFLHDIGKIIIEQLEDYSNPESAEKMYQEHPTYGYFLMRYNAEISAVEKQIIYQHHEHQDGNGFPTGLKGDNLPPVKSSMREKKGRIFRLAEICCVADAYDKMVANPLDKEQLSPQDAIRQLILDAGTKYNKDIIRNLLRVVPIFPVGSLVQVVELDDNSIQGYHGIVAKINGEEINKPIIILLKDKFFHKIKPRMVDTAPMKNVRLKVVL